MDQPIWAEFRRVDELIECYPISKSTERELLELMPDAYGGEPPGEDDWQEPDSWRDELYKLARIWDRLSGAAREDIVAAHDREHEPGRRRDSML